jgi:hypothetical protein
MAQPGLATPAGNRVATPEQLLGPSVMTLIRSDSREKGARSDSREKGALTFRQNKL